MKNLIVSLLIASSMLIPSSVFAQESGVGQAVEWTPETGIQEVVTQESGVGEAVEWTPETGIQVVNK